MSERPFLDKSQIALLPCPFCGGEPSERWPRTITGNEAVQCKSCHAIVPCGPERTEWNKRTPVSAILDADAARFDSMERARFSVMAYGDGWSYRVERGPMSPWRFKEGGMAEHCVPFKTAREAADAARNEIDSSGSPK